MQKSILLYFQGRCFDVNGGVPMILYCLQLMKSKQTNKNYILRVFFLIHSMCSNYWHVHDQGHTLATSIHNRLMKVPNLEYCMWKSGSERRSKHGNTHWTQHFSLNLQASLVYLGQNLVENS